MPWPGPGAARRAPGSSGRLRTQHRTAELRRPPPGRPGGGDRTCAPPAARPPAAVAVRGRHVLGAPDGSAAGLTRGLGGAARVGRARRATASAPDAAAGPRSQGHGGGRPVVQVGGAGRGPRGGSRASCSASCALPGAPCPGGRSAQVPRSQTCLSAIQPQAPGVPPSPRQGPRGTAGRWAGQAVSWEPFPSGGHPPGQEEGWPPGPASCPGTGPATEHHT